MNSNIMQTIKQDPLKNSNNDQLKHEILAPCPYAANVECFGNVQNLGLCVSVTK